MSRHDRKLIAQETLKILEDGYYHNLQGNRVDIKKAQAYAQENSRLYRPDDFLTEVNSQAIEMLTQRKEAPPVQIEVASETTLAACQRLISEGKEKVLALNFASAKNPGGGFLGGSQAQEESLARASGIYFCLNENMEMYNYNRHLRDCLYSDHMIYSPKVPVFRNDEDLLLESPFLASFVTSPAVNAGAVRKNTPKLKGQIESTMLARMDKVLSLAVIHEYEYLVLGAWGCGVFRHQASQVASWFASFLHCEWGGYHRAFTQVVFAICDTQKGQPNLNAFKRVFEDTSQW